jgi:hypothetical protein
MAIGQGEKGGGQHGIWRNVGLGPRRLIFLKKTILGLWFFYKKKPRQIFDLS